MFLPNKRLQIPRRLFAVPERHRREEMMRHVEMRDVVQEEAPLPSEEGPVHRAGGAALEGPGTFAVVREALVGVMELWVEEGKGERNERYQISFLFHITIPHRQSFEKKSTAHHGMEQMGKKADIQTIHDQTPVRSYNQLDPPNTK